MASSHSLLLLFTLSFFCLSSSLPHEAILDAADILSDSGYVSMALTIEVVSQTLLAQSPTLTIFAPSDSTFRKSGQPSLDLLRFHFVPLPFPPQSLRLLPTGAKIPTMFAGHSLIITTSQSDGTVSLNNLRITGSPIYDDGVLLIYGVEGFFDPHVQYPSPSQRPNSDPVCGSKDGMGSSAFFYQAREILNSGGYSLFASFLGMQLSGITGQNAITVFAPPDELVLSRVGNFSKFPSFFFRHVVPCKLLWNDLVSFSDGSELPTFLEGFSVNITRPGGVLMLNEVQVFFPNIFYSDKLVVHGVSDAFVVHKNPLEVAEPLSCTKGESTEENLFDSVEL